MTKKMILILVILIGICVSCQSVEPTAPATTSTKELSHPPTATSLPIEAPNLTKTAMPSDTPVPEEEIELSTDGVISSENIAQIEVLHTLQGHGGQIVDFAFSLDDAQIVSLGGDFSLKRWGTNSGEEVHSLILQGGPVYNGAISPLGNVFAVEGPNHTIQLRDTQDGQIVHEMAGHTSFIMSLNFSPDGSLLATGDSSGSIRVWETETDQLIHALAGHPSPVGALAFSPHNTLLASGGVEGSNDIKIWNLASGEEIASLDKHGDNVYGLAFSPDGATLASASGDGTLKLWDLGSGQALQTFRGHRSRVYGVGFSPDGHLLASSDFDRNVKLWDIASGRELGNLKGHTDLVELVKFSPNGCWLASGSFDSTIILWGIPGTTCLDEPETKSASLSSGEDGLIAFVSTRDGNGEIYTMNADGSEPHRLTNWRLWDGYPAWSPDGSQIAYYSYISSKDWVIKVMDADGSNPRQLTDNGICDGAPYWSPDGTRIAYTSDADCTGEHREIYVMNADGSEQRNLTQNPADDVGSSWSSDSQRIAFASNRDGNYEIYVIDTDRSNVRRLTNDDADDYAPAWSPEGTQIAFYSNRDGDEEIYVMAADGSNLQQLTDNHVADWFPRWSPDGTQITFSSKRDGNLEIYVMPAPGPAAPVNADGSNVRRLTDNPAEDFNSVWQPRSAVRGTAGDSADTWVKTYAGDPVWAALDGLQTADDGYLLVGSTHYSHRNTQQEDVYLVRTDPAGEIVWTRAYGGDGFDRGNAVIQANDGGFVILGDTGSSGAGDWDMVLLKVDADGNELWSRTFGGPAQERANAIQRTTDGGYILVGSTKSFGAGGSDLCLIKTDDLGNEVWSQTYGGELDEEGYDIRLTSDGGFFILAQVTQSARLYTDQNPDIFLLRTDGAGNEIWSQVWEEENVEGGHVLFPTSDGNYIIVGITSSAGSESDIDFLFLKIDADGNLVWDKPISDANAVDYGTDAIETSDGGYLITGMFSDGSHGAIPLIKTDESGQVIWTRNLIEGQGNKAGMRVFPTSDGGFVIVGNTDEYRGAFETVLIKTDSEGGVNEYPFEE